MTEFQAQHSERIGTTIQRAASLLEYSAQHKIEIPPDTVRSVLDATEEFATTSTLTASREFELRMAYRDICRKMYPITIESISDTDDLKRLRGKRLGRLNLGLGVAVLLVLVGTLGVQFYWVIGSSLAHKVQSQLQGYVRTHERIIQLEADLAEEEFTSPEVDQAYLALETGFGQLVAENNALKHWSAWLPFPATAGSSVEYQLSDLTTRVKTDIWNAQVYLLALSSYVLPISYGLLGSMVWVIRRRMEALAASTYTHRSARLDWTRLSLGPVAGIAVGLLLRPDPDSGSVDVFRALGPLGVAFVAGYGIEVLFSMLDRLVSALSMQDSRTAQ